jgi:hypothetical protein
VLTLAPSLGTASTSHLPYSTSLSSFSVGIAAPHASAAFTSIVSMDRHLLHLPVAASTPIPVKSRMS